MITKNNFKKLLQIPACYLLFAIIFNSCRTEELSKDGQLQSSVNQKNLTSRKVFPKEFQNIPSLNENFKTSESVLSQSISTGKMILENAVIDSAYAIEATDGNIISYTFPVYRKNQKNHFENLVLQKKIGDQNFKSYLYQYSRSASVGYDKNNIEIIPLDNLQNSNQGKIIFISHSFTNGCTDITILSVDCNEGGHHSNGTFCPTLGSYMPSDYVVTSNNCTAGGPSDGGSDSPGNPNSGNNQTGGTVIDPDDLPANIQNQMLTTPIPNMPKWGNPLTYTPNFLELNSSQLSFINNTAQNGFRAEMDMFLSNNGINELFGNPTTETLNPDAKAVGKWLVNYYITNSEFQNSENWSDLVNADLQFQQFTKDFLTQNPDITWAQFENWFLKDTPSGFLQQIILQNPATVLNYESLNSPNFKMRKVDQLKYPKFTNTVINIANYVDSNTNVMQTLIQFTGLNAQQILEKLKFGQDPLIQIVDLPGAYGYHNPFTNTVKIDVNYVKKLENSTGANAEIMNLFLSITLLHEFVHWTDGLFFNWTQESGESWEIATYGFIVDTGNVKLIKN